MLFLKKFKERSHNATKEKLTIEKGRFRPDSVSEFIREWSMFLLKNLLIIGIQLKLLYLLREKNSCR